MQPIYGALSAVRQIESRTLAVNNNEKMETYQSGGSNNLPDS